MVQQCSEEISGDSVVKELPVRSTKPSFVWRQEWHELLAFLRKPQRGRGVSVPLSHGWRRILFLLGVDLCFVLLVATPINAILEHWAGLEDKLDFNVRNMFLAVLVAPIIEELIFRAGLRRVGYSLFVGPVLLSLYCAQSFTLIAIVAGVILLAAVVDKILMRRTPVGNGRRFARGRAFIRHYPYVFWFYTVCFGLAHLANFYSTNDRDYLLVFAISAQLGVGCLLGYLRLRQGLASSVILHCLHNSLFVTLLIMFN